MADSRSAAQEPRLFRTLRNDFGVVFKDIGRIGVRQTIKRSLDDLETFYLTTHRRDALAAMGRVRRALFLLFWLLKALFLKLTPARRLLLLAGLWLTLAVQHTSIRVGAGAQASFDLQPLGVLLLLLVLMLELKDKLLARSELEAGRAVQLALMPDRAPQLAGWDLWLFTRSANDVGGDLVDYLHLDSRRLAIVLGDVAGKGLPAALLMAKLQATIRALAAEAAGLGELGRLVNGILCRDGLPNRFATLVHAEIAPDEGSVRLLNAGHMPPLRRSHAIEELPHGSFALGITPDATYDEQRVELQPGEVLLVYSDGVTEAMNRAGEFFGDERLRTVFAATGEASAEQIGRRVLRSVDAFTGDAPIHDDLSLVVIKRVA
jgi:serine phosphatase RsbU (regulator of sigma subunit)